MNGLTDFIKKQLSDLQEMKVFETCDIRVFSLNNEEDFVLRETYTVTRIPGLYFFHCSNCNFSVTEKDLHAAIGYHLATADKEKGKSEVKI